MKINIRAVYLSTVLVLAFASTSMAEIAGSTYDFSASATPTTTITASPTGSYTDPANAAFCVGPNADNCSGSGLFGSYAFSDIDSTHSQITFNFAGSTGSASGNFAIVLGNFVTLDGSAITGVTYDSGNLLEGDFANVSWDGTSATFTGTADGSYNAVFGASVTFDVATTGPATPEPASFALIGLGLLGVSLAHRRITRSAR